MLTLGLCLSILALAPQVPLAPQAPQAPPGQPGAAAQRPETSVRVVVHGRAGLVERLIRAGFAATSYPALSKGAGAAAAEVMLDVRRLPALYGVAGRGGVVSRGQVMIMEYSRPMREIIAARRRAAAPSAPDPRYHTAAEIAAELAALERSYPALAKRYDLNARYRQPLTHDGNRIYGLRISDYPARDEDEPAMLMVTNHHSRELNTIVASLHAAEQLLSTYRTDPAVKRLVDENQLWIVPTMNPDGLDFVWTSNNMWRKNRRRNSATTFGVDLNRNYPYFWSRCGSSSNPGSDIYHGPSAGSEPETKVMVAMAKAEVFDRVLDMHSYGRDMRYGYNRLTGPNLPASLKAYYDRIQAELAGAMRYRVRASCCCGGQQHFQLAENGSLAYLGEMGTGMQPAWSRTLAEVQRVYGGVKFFFQRPVPLRGHVRSLAGNKPLAAEFEVVGAALVDGQFRRSSARHGRYAAWLPTGTYRLLFKAPGHDSKIITVRLVDGTTASLDVTLMPTLRPTTLTTRGTPRLGGSMAFDLSSPGDSRLRYVIGVAFGGVPGIDIGARNVPLNNDSLLASWYRMTTVFVNTFGQLSASGMATMTFRVPAVPVLAGLRLQFCGLSIDDQWPASVKGISNGVAVSLVR